VHRASADIRSILEQLEIEEFPYREFFRQEGRSRYSDTWLLLSETNRALLTLWQDIADQSNRGPSAYRRDIESPYEDATRRSAREEVALVDQTRAYVSRRNR
jgi:hypothetical protein